MMYIKQYMKVNANILKPIGMKFSLKAEEICRAIFTNLLNNIQRYYKLQYYYY